MKINKLFPFTFLSIIFSCFCLHISAKESDRILPGAYNTNLYFPFLKGKTISVVANATSEINRTHLVDTLLASGIKIKFIFAPEHGFRGDRGAGDDVENSVDKKTGIKIISLYGKNKGPEINDLHGTDILIFDIQDVGVRFYTYISTLQYVMQACAISGTTLIILDRPDPNGFYIDGPLLEKKYSSFVGMQSIPVVYGMTIGEYAMMLNGEGWLKDHKKCKLKVIPVLNYRHSDHYELPVNPSPNLPDMDAVYLYPSICFFEGTRISLGRGTNKPFRLIGFPGDSLSGISFIPKNIPGVAVNPPYRDTLCKGLDLSGEGKKIIEQPGIKLKWLLSMYALYPEKQNFFTPFFEKLSGSKMLQQQILSNRTEEEIKSTWKKGLIKFQSIRKKYLLYPDFEWKN